MARPGERARRHRPPPPPGYAAFSPLPRVREKGANEPACCSICIATGLPQIWSYYQILLLNTIPNGQYPCSLNDIPQFPQVSGPCMCA